MELPKIKDLVKDKKVFFHFYRDGELWYITEDGFEFPIPPEDMRGAIFKREDKAILFMRFIRKHLEYLQNAVNEAEELVKLAQTPPTITVVQATFPGKPVGESKEVGGTLLPELYTRT